MDLPGYEPGEVLTMAEASEVLGCNADTFQQSYVWPWAISHVRVAGRPVFFRSELEKAMAERPRQCWRNCWKEKEAA